MLTTQDGEVHHMRVTASGQVSVPAAVRRRWSTSRVRIVDHGDHLVVEPEPDNPFAKYRGILAGLPLTSDELRERNREDERRAEARRADG